MKKIIFLLCLISLNASAAYPTALNGQITDSAVEETASSQPKYNLVKPVEEKTYVGNEIIEKPAMKPRKRRPQNSELPRAKLPQELHQDYGSEIERKAGR